MCRRRLPDRDMVSMYTFHCVLSLQYSPYNGISTGSLLKVCLLRMVEWFLQWCKGKPGSRSWPIIAKARPQCCKWILEIRSSNWRGMSFSYFFLLLILPAFYSVMTKNQLTHSDHLAHSIMTITVMATQMNVQHVIWSLEE